MNRLEKDPAFKRNMRIFEGGFKSIPLLDGYRKRPDDPQELLGLPETTEEEPTPLESLREQLARDLGGRADLVRRVIALRDDHPYGTAIELIALEYLQRRGERYIYQAALFGGNKPGGVIPDFVLMKGGAGTALMINGGYWHNRPGQQQNDESDKMRLLGAEFMGVRINRVVNVWESRILSDPEETMDAAIQGVELAR